MRFVFKRKGKVLGSIGRSPDSGGGIDRQIPVEVGDEEECEACAYVVCVPDEIPSEFTDNVVTECAKCGRKIHHRPYAPKKPPKICLDCFVKTQEAAS